MKKPSETSKTNRNSWRRNRCGVGIITEFAQGRSGEGGQKEEAILKESGSVEIYPSRVEMSLSSVPIEKLLSLSSSYAGMTAATAL
jgi:hypothetical protein